MLGIVVASRAAPKSPPLRLGPSDRSTSPPLRGGEEDALHRRHARRSVWLFQRTFLATGEEVGKRGAWPCLSIISTWRSVRAPPAFFCPEADLTAFALRLPAKGLGFMVSAQTAHRHAANPAPSSLHAHPVHDPCSREGDAGDYRSGWNSVEKRPRIIFEIEQNQWLGGNVYPRGKRKRRAIARPRRRRLAPSSVWRLGPYRTAYPMESCAILEHSR